MSRENYVPIKCSSCHREWSVYLPEITVKAFKEHPERATVTSCNACRAEYCAVSVSLFPDEKGIKDMLERS